MHSPVWSRAAILAVLVIFTAGIYISTAPEEVEGAGGASVYIKLDEIQKTVQVIPGMGGVVTFTGEIQTEDPRNLNAQVIIVTLETSVPDAPDWYVTGIPPLTVTRGQTIISFSFSVRVPLSSITSGMDMVRKVIVSGSWIYEPGLTQGEVPQAEGTIFIGQYYQYTVTSPTPFIQTSPGGEIDIELDILNQGNGDDIVVVAVQNKEYLAEEGWVIEQKENRFDLPFQGSINVPIRIIAPTDWDPWVNDITFIKFRIYSVQAENSQTLMDGEQVLYSVYVNQSGVAVPGFDPSLIIISLFVMAAACMYKRRV